MCICMCDHVISFDYVLRPYLAATCHISKSSYISIEFPEIKKSSLVQNQLFVIRNSPRSQEKYDEK